ncbi:MAG: REP-associated tyrosine transposase [bacterium]|jgi:putative transposase
MSAYRRWFVPGGTYFFTVVTYQRYPFFKDETARDILRKAWCETNNIRPYKNLASVLLHDHFHCMWTLPDGDLNFSARIKSIKDIFTTNWLAIGGHEVLPSKSQKERGNRGIWQRRFWEHLIQDESDLEKHFDYIHYNPVKHNYASRPADWPHSTFHRYVQSGHYDNNWGNTLPMHIKDLNYE